MNLKEHIKKVLKEETQLPLSVMRRINHLDDIFMKVRNEISWYVCNFRNSNILLSYLYEKTLEEFYYTWMSEVVSDEDWETTAPKIEEYLDNNYRESTEMYWNDKCKRKNSSRRKEETEGVGGYAAPAFEMEPDHVHFKHQYNEETELTEKCWKGYTQKGMKTMFGKRYPNCVKKTK